MQIPAFFLSWGPFLCRKVKIGRQKNIIILTRKLVTSTLEENSGQLRFPALFHAFKVCGRAGQAGQASALGWRAVVAGERVAATAALHGACAPSEWSKA